MNKHYLLPNLRAYFFVHVLCLPQMAWLGFFPNSYAATGNQTLAPLHLFEGPVFRTFHQLSYRSRGINQQTLMFFINCYKKLFLDLALGKRKRFLRCC